METSSEYSFPIFISSTDYNLKDLRAELARFLSELGYRPILSSAEGFPDCSPILEPWESCLPVLDKCFVMVLIIDGQYGDGLNWVNYKEFFGEKKVSPTHGEYFFAHTKRKRMLVFIRKSLMPHYQSYRAVMKSCGDDKEKAKNILAPTLPKYVSFETLDFINIVKTSKPIPWINEFDDITSVKKEIQKKMLNELAELFLVKNKHFETVIDSFNKVMDALTRDEQKKVLSKINATKEITEAVDKRDLLEKELNSTTVELEKAKTNNSKDKEKYERKIDSLSKKIIKLEEETQSSSNSQFFIQNGQVKFGNPNYIDYSALNYIPGTILNNGLPWESSFIGGAGLSGIKCDGCGTLKISTNPGYLPLTYTNKPLNRCNSCHRNLCDNCWPKNNSIGYVGTGINYYAGSSSNLCPMCTEAASSDKLLS